MKNAGAEASNAPVLRPCGRPQFPERGRARVRPGIAGRADLSCHCYVPKCPAAVCHGAIDIDHGPAAVDHGPAAVDHGPADIDHGPAAVFHGRFPWAATPADYNDACRDEDNSRPPGSQGMKG